VSVATAPAEGPALEAPAHARARRGGPRLTFVLFALVAVIVLLRFVVAEPFAIPSDSMAPTLTRGDHVLVDKLAYRGSGEPRAGELVVFHAPRSDDILLKRVVAVAGQTVEIDDGALVVDGRRPREPYADPKAIDTTFFGPVRVPAGSVFVLGDNRRDSEDSRTLGAISVDDVIGRARARIWPPARWGGWD
jgi:signal peptidase I